MSDSHLKYVVISPAKDEEQHVEKTLQSMVRQTISPMVWVIVDDGSSDRTPDIVADYAEVQPFIRLVRTAGARGRQPGSAVICAFNRGYEEVRSLDYDYIVKLDCDLSFEPDYFEKLLVKFVEQPRLGIASGIYEESADGRCWREITMPSYHAAGASKIVRRECFEEIGGFVPRRGWDTVDEIRAMAKGWETRHFPDYRMKHWKIEGSGIGSVRTNKMHGEIYYLTGGSKLFLCLKVLHRMAHRPYLVGGAALLWGYVKMVLRREPLLVTEAEASHYKSLLNARVMGRSRDNGRTRV